MKKIIGYKVVEGISASFNVEVKHLIMDGWQPYGAPHIWTSSTGKFWMAQAMILYGEETSSVGPGGVPIMPFTT